MEPKINDCRSPPELQSIHLKTTNQARNLGVVMDSDLNLEKHIKAITKSAYYHLKNISVKTVVSRKGGPRCRLQK